MSDTLDRALLPSYRSTNCSPINRSVWDGKLQHTPPLQYPQLYTINASCKRYNVLAKIVHYSSILKLSNVPGKSPHAPEPARRPLAGQLIAVFICFSNQSCRGKCVQCIPDHRPVNVRYVKLHHME